MTRFRSSLHGLPLASALALAACAPPSGEPASRIAEPQIAAVYIPLIKSVVLGIGHDAAAATVIAPGIAATNAHNANLIDPKLVIGQVSDYDLLFYHTTKEAAPATAAPVAGGAVTAYGEDTKKRLRIAHGTVREIVRCAGCAAPAYFTFSNDARGDADAGPGFSGGPVVDDSGKLVGITFGYKDTGSERLIYAYDMARVSEELALLQHPAPDPVHRDALK